MGKKIALAVVALAALAAPTVLDHVQRTVSPFIVAAKCWDETEGATDVDFPGKVICTNRNYYFSTNTCPAETFPIFESKTDKIEQYPAWINEGKQEVLDNYLFPKNVGMRARFAARYLVLEKFLSDEAKLRIKVLGIAFFENSDRFTPEQRTLLKNSLIYFLKVKK